MTVGSYNWIGLRKESQGEMKGQYHVQEIKMEGESEGNRGEA